METARRIRKTEGKHVIPVPTFEIKKDFSGYILDPLQIFKSKGKNNKPYIAEKSIIRPTFSYLGNFKISDTVFRQIIEYLASKTDFIDKIIKTRVDKTPEGPYIYMEVIVNYGYNIMEGLAEFKEKSKKFEEFLAGRTIREAVLELEEKNFELSKDNVIEMRISNKLDSETELKGKVKKLPENKIPIVIAGGSFNAKNRETVLDENGKKAIKKLIENLNDEKVYFVVGHKLSGYEKAVLDASKEANKKFEINAIIPKEVSAEEVDELLKQDINGIRISTEREEMGIYKSFNYEIFERRNSIVVAFDGNSPVSNLVQEAKNGKGKAKIYVNSEVEALKDKANSLDGYVKKFKINDDLAEAILKDHPEIGV